MPLINDLQKLGLSDKEAKVYLATLELGQETVQNIAKKASVNRATTYLVLDSLVSKGLTSRYDVGKKTYFAASNPEALSGLFELKKKEIEQDQKYLESLLPQLKTVANKEAGKPVIRFYEGKEGIQSCHQDFLLDQTTKEEVARTFFPLDTVQKVFNQTELDKYKQERVKKHIASKVLYTSPTTTQESTTISERRKVSEKDFPFTCDVAIYGDSIRIASLGDKLSAVLIKDKEIAKTFKSLFDLAWEGAEAKKKK